MVDLLWLVVGDGGFILGGGRWWWVYLGGGGWCVFFGWWWMVVSIFWVGVGTGYFLDGSSSRYFLGGGG